MNESSNRLVRKFNPGTFQSDEEVIAQFVVRQRELGIVLDVLRGNIDSASCQHVLVVGPRGWGKTMLLARVAAELNADDKLSECLLPVRFMEESHEIFNLTDFWLETLFYLVRESASRDPELARELREVHAELVKRWGEETLADRVRATVLDAADRLGKRLVLMIENMQDLCANVEEDFGWQLRETLQSEPQVMLLATATSRFRGLDNVEQPFFELFRIISLAPLDTEECRHLWKVVSGDHVSGREIRPLEILTGGSPRLLVIIAGFAQHRSLHQLMEDLVQLIDDHTEYFRNHLEVFAKSERRVYLGVIDLWQPSSTGEIAMRARMDVRTVSTLLGRLVKRGAVTGKKIGKKRFYTATARLYSLYYKLRRERDEAAVVRHLIHFMSVFYSEAELAEMSVKLMAEAEKFPIIWEGIERAIEEVPDIGSMFPNMVRPNIDRVSRPAMAIDDENVERLLEEVTTVFDKAAKYEELGEFASAIATYDEAITRIGDSDTPELLDSIAWALVQKGDAQGELGEFASAIATYDEAITRIGDTDAPELLDSVVWVLVRKGDAHRELGEFASAIAAYDEAITRIGDSDTPELPDFVAVALVQKGNAQGQLGEFVSAIATYDEAIARLGNSDSPESPYRIGLVLSRKGNAQGELGEFASAIATYDEAITRIGDSNAPELLDSVAWVLLQKGDAQGQLGEFSSAIETYDEAITRIGDSDTPELLRWISLVLSQKGDTQGKLGEFASAIATYDEAIARIGDSSNPQDMVILVLARKGMRQIEMGHTGEALHTCEEIERKLGVLADDDKMRFALRVIWMRMQVLLVQGQHQAAMDTFRSAYAVFVPGNETMMYWMQRIVLDLVVAGASTRELVEILESDSVKSDALVPLIVALRRYTGEAVRAPEEIFEVATDILKRIGERMAGDAGVDSDDLASLSDFVEGDRE